MSIIARHFSRGIVDILSAGGVGIIPTDTIYGIVGSALKKETVERIYRLRERNIKKPMIVLIGSIADLKKFGATLSPHTKKIITKLWSGDKPVSIVFPIRVTGYMSRFFYLHRGKGSIAFRIPAKKSLRELLKETGPLVAPSANLEGKPPARTIDETRKYFSDRVDFYVDGGKIDGTPSRLIKIIHGAIKILRKSVIKAIIFDIGGVLTNLSPALEDIQEEFKLSKKEVDNYVLPLLQQHEKGQITERIFWRLLKSRLNIRSRIPSPSPLIRRYRKEIKINKPILAIAQQLKRQGYMIAIISDTNPVHAKHLKNIGLFDHFQEVITSCQNKSAKPEQKIFRIALQKIRVSPYEAIFIDDKKENVQAAQTIGMTGILFTTEEKLKMDLNRTLPKLRIK